MPSSREEMANRIAAWLQSQDKFFSNVLQSFQERDDGKPGGGYLVAFTAPRDVHCQLVVWNEKRLDFHTDMSPSEAWSRFDNEEEFYAFAQTAWNIQGPISKTGWKTK